MYKPNISQLIAELESVKVRHGDIEVIGYANHGDVTYEQVGAEFNDDDGIPVCLLTVERADD